MATPEDIERRVTDTDTPRTARRCAVAQRISELAARHTDIAGKLADIERELRDVLTETRDVIEIDELAAFTDIPATDLTGWLGEQKPFHTKRKKTTTGSASTAPRAQNRKPAAPATPEQGKTPASQDGFSVRDGAAGTLVGAT